MLKKVLTCLLLLPSLAAGAQNPGQPVPSEIYGMYFVPNNIGFPGMTAHLVFSNQAELDQVFHPAAVMGGNHFVPSDAFNTKIVVATVLPGTYSQYRVTWAEIRNGALWIWYDVEPAPATATPGASGITAGQLILGFDRGAYNSVVFVENSHAVAWVPIQ